jgi:hypothetical protein
MSPPSEAAIEGVRDADLIQFLFIFRSRGVIPGLHLQWKRNHINLQSSKPFHLHARSSINVQAPREIIVLEVFLAGDTAVSVLTSIQLRYVPSLGISDFELFLLPLFFEDKMRFCMPHILNCSNPS